MMILEDNKELTFEELMCKFGESKGNLMKHKLGFGGKRGHRNLAIEIFFTCT